MPPRRPRRRSAADTPPDISSSTTTTTGPLAALAAANALIALPWEDLGRQQAAAAERSILESIDDRELIREGNGGGEFRWSFSLRTQDASVSVDLTNPPGFSHASLSGLEILAPLHREWGVSINAALRARARVWNPRTGAELFSWTPVIPWEFRVRRFGLTAGAQLDPTPPDRPAVQAITVHARLDVEGIGAIPITVPLADFRVAISNGCIKLSRRLTNLSLGLGDLGGKLTGDLEVSIGMLSGDQTTAEAAGVDDEPTETDRRLAVRVSLSGIVAVRLEKVGRISCALGFDFSFLIKSFTPLHDLLTVYGQGVPRIWGEGAHPLGQTPAPPAAVDFADAAAQIDAALASAHVPNGTVFSIQRWPQIASRSRSLPLPDVGESSSPVTERSRVEDLGTVGTDALAAWESFYCLEEDSAIWTSHYLAAQAFRYAATATPEALHGVQKALGGVQRLFEVTTDAVRRGDQRWAIHDRGLFARSALPTDSAIKWWEADHSIEHNRCYYERPEGGWDVTHAGGTTHFQRYAEVEAFAREHPAILHNIARAVRPVGRVWRGLGCGDRCGKRQAPSGEAHDHPVSRDQYAGIFMGLFAAHQLVSDPGVQATCGQLITDMLEYLLTHKWNVPLPPNGHICTSYIGNLNHQVAFLAMGMRLNPAAFGAAYARYVNAAELSWIPIFISAAEPLVDYYKFNLAHAVAWPALAFETDEEIRAKHLIGYNMLRRAIGHHRNAYFNLVRILIERPEHRALLAASAPSGSNEHLSRQDEIRSTLAEWIRRWQKVKGPNSLPTNIVADANYQIARWPNDVATYVPLDNSDPTLRCVFALPVDGRPGKGMDYVWQKDPFGVALKGDFAPSAVPTLQDINEYTGPVHRNREGPGVDYLLAYWLAVYLQVLPGPE